MSKVAHQAGAYLGFRNMKQLTEERLSMTFIASGKWQK